MKRASRVPAKGFADVRGGLKKTIGTEKTQTLQNCREEQRCLNDERRNELNDEIQMTDAFPATGISSCPPPHFSSASPVCISAVSTT